MCSPAWEMNGSGRNSRSTVAGSVRATASGDDVLSSRAVAQGTREGSRRRRRRARARPPIYGGERAGGGLPRRRRDAGPDGPSAGLRRRSGLGRASGSAQSGRCRCFRPTTYYGEYPK
jgi:hypothetical protein